MSETSVEAACRHFSAEDAKAFVRGMTVEEWADLVWADYADDARVRAATDDAFVVDPNSLDFQKGRAWAKEWCKRNPLRLTTGQEPPPPTLPCEEE